MVMTTSILRPASSLRTHTTSNRVTFADDLINLALNKLPLARRPPPSTAVPSLPSLPSVARRKEKRERRDKHRRRNASDAPSEKRLKEQRKRKSASTYDKSSRYSTRSTSNLTDASAKSKRHRCKKHERRKTRQRDTPPPSSPPLDARRREQRITQLLNSGALANAKRYIRAALQLGDEQRVYAWDMWDAVDARALHKIYQHCRKHCVVDARVANALRPYEADLRRWMVEEESELKTLLRARVPAREARAASTRSRLTADDRRHAKRKRLQVAAFIAEHLSVPIETARKLKRSQLDKGAISAVAARTQRMCSCED